MSTGRIPGIAADAAHLALLAENERMRAALIQIKAIKDIGADLPDLTGGWRNETAAERDAMYRTAVEGLAVPGCTCLTGFFADCQACRRPLSEANVCPHCHQARCGCDDPASHAGTSHLPDEPVSVKP